MVTSADLPSGTQAMQAFSPEARLLLCWARPTLSQGATARVDELLGGTLDWGCFARYAVRHGLAPLVAEHLRRAPDQRVPPPISAAFADLGQANRDRNLRLSGELLIILRALAAAGIAVISLKGPALAAQADGDPTLRIIADLDLLVAPEDALAVREILGSRGYGLQRGFELTESDDVFVRRSDRAVVEVHRRLDSPWWPLDLPVDSLLRAPESAPLLGMKVPVLPLEDNLLYQCHHAGRHVWNRLAWLTSFAGLLERRGSDLDAEHFADRARKLGMARAVGATLMLARDLLEIWPCPPALERLTATPGAAALVRLARRELFDEQRVLTEPDPVAAAARLLGIAARAGPAPGAALKAELNIRVRRPQILRAVRQYHLLGGSGLRFLGWFLFSPKLEDVRRLGIAPSRRAAYAVARPLLLAGRLTNAVALRLMPARRDPGA